LERRRLGQTSAAPSSQVQATPVAQAAASSLTSEQQLQIERNRQAAIERRRQELLASSAVSPVLPPDKLLQIERNRLAALERQRLASQVVSAKGQEATEKLDEAEEDEECEEEEEEEEEDELASEDLEGIDLDELLAGLTSSSESDSESASASRSSGESGTDTMDTDSSDGESESSSNSSSSASATRLAATSASQDLAPPAVPPTASAPSAASAAPAPATLRAEQLAVIERNRLAALERRRLQAEALATPKTPDASTPDDGESNMIRRIFDDLTPSKVPLPKSGKERGSKQKLVAKILCRWWYVMPSWPPEDFDFDGALRSAGFRHVPVEAFEFEPDHDELGLEKVFAVSGYLGLFRTEQGILVDARPLEGKPSYNQLMLKSTPELHTMLLASLSNQLKELESQPNSGRDFETYRQELKAEIKEARRATSFSQFFKVGASKCPA